MEDTHINLKEKIENILKNTQSKQFASRLRNFPDELAQLEEFTKQYLPKTISEQLFILLKGPPMIKSCGKYPIFDSFEKGYRTFCGSRSKCQCSRDAHSKVITAMNNSFSLEEKQAIQQKREQTNLKKYGFKNPALNAEVKTKTEQSNLKLYNAATPFQSEIVQEKIKQTCLEKYGVERPLQSETIQQKVRDTTLQKYGGLMTHARAASYAKYGGLNPFVIEEVKEKTKATLQKKYGRTSPKQFHLTDEQLEILSDEELFKDLITGKTAWYAGRLLNVDPRTIRRYCDKYNLYDKLGHSLSCNEIIIKEILDAYNIEYEIGNKILLNGLQLDFYLPKYKVAIEVGAIYNHSELKRNRGKWYHWNKWSLCHEQGITLFQWFDDELNMHYPVIKNKILYVTNNIHYSIGARKIKLGPVSSVDEREFLNNNHIQGYSKDRTSELVLGGYYNNELIAVITFANRKNYYELTRFATKLEMVFPGLFSKMFKYSLPKLTDKKIISFSANCHSNGFMYSSNGFVIDHFLDPAYYYTKDYHSRLNRQGFMKHKILKRNPELDPLKSEWELVQELGYDRFWDAGKIAWRYDQ